MNENVKTAFVMVLLFIFIFSFCFAVVLGFLVAPFLIAQFQTKFYQEARVLWFNVIQTAAFLSILSCCSGVALLYVIARK